MVKSCAAYRCTNRALKNSHVSFHKFPVNLKLRKMWVLATRREKFVPSKYSVLCSEHFKDSDFIFKIKGNSRLKEDAVPSIFNFPQHLLPKHNPRKIKNVKQIENTKKGEQAHCEKNDDIYLPSTSEVHSKSILKRKRKEPSQFGDFKKEDLQCPLKAERMWIAGKERIGRLQRKIKAMEIKNKRLTTKMKTLKNLVEHLTKSKKISEDCTLILNETIPAAEKDLLLRQLKKVPGSKFPEHLRSFALTLHFYSPNAYSYVRKTFGNCLPHPSTLRKWLATVDGSPGYTAESIAAIKIKVAELKKDGKNLMCGLIMDEMCIKQHVHWNGKKYVGLVDLGTNIDTDALPEAKQALVFLLVALNSRWKIPIAYFLIDGLAGTQRANLVKGCLKIVHDCGAKIVSLTFDGTVTNFTVGTLLGAKLRPPDIAPWFLHPFTKERVHIFLDPCHMVKLIRNALCEWKCLLINGNTSNIKWSFFEQLVKLQDATGLHAANKLTKRHLNFKNEIMKVKLAVQLFSDSVADALDFCNLDLGLDNFKDSEATSNFCRIINNVFDILNTRNYLSKNPWRKPFTTENENQLKQYFEFVENFVISLTDSCGNPVLYTRRNTGFVGLIICLRSLGALFDDVVKTEKHMKYILSYKVSQDHIEMFFSAIRSRGGFTNNPTATQFQAAYKRLLLHAEITTSVAANCISQEQIAILSVPSTIKPKIDSLILGESEVFYEPHELDLIHPNAEFIDDVVEYIAGFVSRKVAKIIHCSTCTNHLFKNTSDSQLLKRKNRGGLCKATSDVLAICKCAERIFRSVSQSSATPHINHLLIFTARQLNYSNLFQDLTSHFFDQDPLNNHAVQLIKIISEVYFNIRIHHLNKKRNEKELHIRHKYSKLILFKNQ